MKELFVMLLLIGSVFKPSLVLLGVAFLFGGI